MPSFAEIFGSTAAPKQALSFDQIFAQPPAAPPSPAGVADFLGSYEDPGVPQPDMMAWMEDPVNNPPDPNWVTRPQAAPPVQGMPQVQGVLDNYNLSGYTDPSLKEERGGFELPKSALTPSAISDFNARKYAEEAKAAKALEDETFQAFTTPFSGRSEDFRRRKELKDAYYSKLPYPISEDVRADKELFARYRRLNELATGRPLLDTPYENIQPLQSAIDDSLANMQAMGIDDPQRYMMEAESGDGPQGFFGRNVAAAWDTTKRTAANVYDALSDPPGDDTFNTRIRQEQAAWREGVEDIKDERSALPNAFNEIARAASQSGPQLAAAAGVGAITKNPALAWATMLGPSGIENFQVGRANGMSGPAAAGRAVALAGVEYATAKMGGKLAEKAGMQTFEELAFGTAQRSVPTTKVGKLIQQAADEAFGVGGKAAKETGLGPLLTKIGGSTIEGGEEVGAQIAQQFTDYVVGLEDELIGDETPSEVGLAFAVGLVAAAGMHGVSSVAKFIRNPTEKNATAAGITHKLAPTQVARESLAAAAAAKIVELEPTAPYSPADAAQPDVTQGPELPPEAAQATPQEPALPPEPEPTVQPSSEKAAPGPLLEPTPKRRLGDKKTAEPTVKESLTVPVEPSQTLKRTASWVVRNKETGEVQFETFNPAEVEKLNKEKYEAVPILDYLTNLNREIAAAGEPPAESGQPADVYQDTPTQQTPQEPAPPTESGQSPATSGQDTPSVAPPDAPPVATSQAPADSGVAREPWQMTRAEFLDSRKGDKRTTDADYDRVVWNAYFDDKISRDEVDSRTIRDTQGNKHVWAKTRQELEQDKKDAIKAAKKERADINKQKSTKDFASWRIRSQSNNAKQNIANVEQYQQGLLDVHKDRVREAMDEGKPVPAEVLADYPDLAKQQEPEPAPTPKKKLGQKRTEYPTLKGEDVQRMLRETALTTEEADLLYETIEKRAKFQGISVDDYVAKRFALITKANRSESVYLKQLASGKPDALAQGSKAPKPNAEIQFLAEDGRAIIRAFTEGQNFSSLLHELLHVFELDLTDVQRASLDNWLGRGDWTYNGAKPGKTKDGKWNRAAREKFARAGERYFREGKAPTPELEGVFAKFKEWLSSVYKTIKGSPIDVELSPDIRSVLDELFGKKKLGDKKAKPAKVQVDVPPSDLEKIILYETKGQDFWVRDAGKRGFEVIQNGNTHGTVVAHIGRGDRTGLGLQGAIDKANSLQAALDEKRSKPPTTKGATDGQVQGRTEGEVTPAVPEQVQEEAAPVREQAPSIDDLRYLNYGERKKVRERVESGDDKALNEAIKENEKRKKSHEDQVKKNEADEVERMQKWRNRAKQDSVNNRYWKELTARSRKLKGKNGEIQATIKLYEDPKDTSKVTGVKKEPRKAEILTPELAIAYTQEGDGGKKEYTLTHIPTGLSMSGGTQNNLRQLAQLVIESGIDLKGISDDAKSEAKDRLGKLVKAWDNSTIGDMPDDLAKTIVDSVKVTETKTKADIVLDSADLGAFKVPGTGLKDATAKIKEIAKAAPEFAYEPVFTVNAEKQLVFKDGVTYKLDPGLFNLAPGELTEGQTVGINIEDLGIEPLTAEGVVIQSLKNWGFSGVRSDKKGGVTGSWKDSKVYLTGSGDQWTVTGDETKDSVKNARFALKKIHWLADGKAKAAPAVKAPAKVAVEPAPVDPDVLRVVKKLTDWQAGDKTGELLDFRSSYSDYDDQKRQAIIAELARVGAVPLSLPRKKNVTATQIVDHLRTRYASEKYAAAEEPADTLYQDSGNNITSLSNAKVDKDRAALGLPPMMAPMRQANQAAWDEAIQKINEDKEWLPNLVNELTAKPRAVDPVENSALLHRRITLRTEHAKALDALAKANESGNKVEIAAASKTVNERLAILSDFEVVTKNVGSADGRALQARKMFADDDYSLVKMELEARAAKGDDITPSERAEIKRLQEEITRLQAKLSAKEEADTQKKLDLGIDALLGEIKKTQPKGNQKPIDDAPIISAIKQKVRKGETQDITSLVQRLAHYFWQKGVRQREPMTDALHGVLEKLIPGWTREQTRRAFNGYGDFTPVSMDDMTVGIADLKAQDREVMKAEAILAGKPLEKTGLQRREDSNEVRRLKKVTNELKRLHGVVVTDPETQLKSALGARKTYYRHRMADLKHEIDTRQLIIKTKSPSPTDAELDGLIAEYNELKRQHSEIFKKPGLTDEQRLAIAIEAAKRNEQTWITKLENAKMGVFNVETGKKQPVTSAQLEAIQARVEAIRAEVSLLKDLDSALQEQKKVKGLKTALETIEQTIKDGDVDLTQPVQGPDSKEVFELKEKLNIAREQLRQLRELKGVYNERRLTAAKEAAQKAIDSLDARIKAGDTSVQKNSKAGPVDSELKYLRYQRDYLNKVMAEMRNAQKPKKSAEDISLAALKSRMKTRMADLKQRMADGDFVKKPRKKITLDSEAIKAREELDKVVADYQKMLAKFEWDQLSKMEKVTAATKAFLGNAWDFGRVLRTTGEMSVFLRQGFIPAMAHPLRTAKTAGQAAKAFAPGWGGEKYAAAVEEEIFNHPKYDEMRAAGVHFTTKDSSLNQREEALMSRWMGNDWNIKGVNVNPLKPFDRAARVFLNKVRFDSYLFLEHTVTRTGTADGKEAKMLASFVNESTGRGSLGKDGEKAGVLLARFFFSPRYLASRVQLLVGHSMWGGSNRTRRAIAMEYVRAARGIAIFTGMLAWTFSGSDDEDDKLNIELDWRSSDFGKLRIGDTRLDLLAGFGQIGTFVGRLWTGETKNQYGEVEVIRGEGKEYIGQDAKDVLFNFVRSKLHPTFGSGVNIVVGTDYNGNPTEISREISGAFIPITYPEMIEISKNHDFMTSAKLGVLAFMGVGLQHYSIPPERLHKYAAKQAAQAILSNGRPQQIKKRLGSKEPPETDEEYAKRLANWEADREWSKKWLTENKNTPLVQDIVTEMAKKIPAKPEYKPNKTGPLAGVDLNYSKQVREWNLRYKGAADLVKSLR